MFQALAMVVAVVSSPPPPPGLPCEHPAVPKIMVSARGHDGTRVQRPYAVVVFNVAATGVVEAVHLDESSGDAGLDGDALKAAKQWSFLPAATGCRSIPSTISYTVGFGYGEKTFADPCNHNTLMLLGVTPDYPENARRMGLGATSVNIKLAFDASARLVSADVLTTSGIADIDRSAMRGALASAYSGTVKNCVPVPGVYGFLAAFDPG